MRWSPLAASMCALALACAGCGTAASRPPAAGRHLHLTISGYAFHPSSLTVPVGTRVTFVNDDATAHTATAAGGVPAFDTGTLTPHGSRTIVLMHPGTYTYFCQFHAFMRGTIRVTAG